MLAGAVIVAFYAIADQWVDPDTGITWTYTVSGDEASVGGGDSNSPAVPKSTAGAITIPSVLGGVPVVSIGRFAFQSCGGLTSVTIPSSVTQIMYRAFYLCKAITTITIPEGVTKVENQAFYRCEGLTSIRLPDRLTEVGCEVFYGCIGLTTVAIPEGVTSIGVGAFGGCSGLASVFIPSGVTNVDSRAFWYCSSLSSVVLPEGVVNIGDSAFQSSGLMYVTMPESVVNIGDLAFRWCGKLVEITIPPRVVRIGERVLDGCSELKTLEIPDGVIDIGPYAFSSCSGLTSVSMPSSVTNIGSASFHGCCALTSLRIPSSVASIGDNAFEGSGLVSVALPEGLVKIGKEVFHGCNNLTSVNIPSSVTSIGESAFENCNALISISIPSNVVDIGDSAFWNCSRLTSIEMQEGVSCIGSCAFYCCNNLISVDIPSTVKSIGDEAFYGCNKIVVAFVRNEPQDCVKACFGNRVWYQKKGTPIEYEWSYCSFGGEGVSVSGVRPAWGDVEIPMSLGGSVVKSIGAFVFNGCEGLSSIKIPSTVTTIGEGAFEGCKGVQSIEIPSAVLSVGEGAFRYCSSLSQIAVETENAAYSSVDGVLYNKARTELIQWPLKISGSLSIAPKITSISAGAFEACGMTSVTLPSSLKNIGARAFAGCGNMASIVIPSTLTSVGKHAFDNCWSLKLIRVIPGGDLEELKLLLSEGGVDVDRLTFEYVEDLIPKLEPDADAAAVRAALEGSADGHLAENITDADTYGLYRDWAMKIGEGEVFASSYAWASFATDSATLLMRMPKDEDLKIEEFVPSPTSGSFEFTVSVKGVMIGDKACENMLKKLFGLEGSEMLDSAMFVPDSVALVFKKPQDGKLKFTAMPVNDNAKSFFMRMTVK